MSFIGRCCFFSNFSVPQACAILWHGWRQYIASRWDRRRWKVTPIAILWCLSRHLLRPSPVDASWKGHSTIPESWGCWGVCTCSTSASYSRLLGLKQCVAETSPIFMSFAERIKRDEVASEVSYESVHYVYKGMVTSCTYLFSCNPP